MKRQIISQNNRKVRLSLEPLETRVLLAADLGSEYFRYVSGDRETLTAIPGEFVVGTDAESEIDLQSLFGQIGSPQRHYDLQHLSDSQVRIKTDVSLLHDVNSEFVLDQLGIDAASSGSEIWISPAFETESGHSLSLTDEIIVQLESGVDPAEFFEQSTYASYRSLRGTTDQFVATLADGGGIEALRLANDVLPNQEGVIWADVNAFTEAQTSVLPFEMSFDRSRLWHLNDELFPLIDGDINAPQAWDLSMAHGTTLAVFDTGIELNHPDLTIWTNTGEIAGNGLDDDGNGWVDDVNGLDTVNTGNDPSPQPGFVDRHGTAVAGAAAATVNNSAGGAAGSAWGADVMMIKIGNENADGTFSTNNAMLAQSILYAAGFTSSGGRWAGADVANHSWSGGSSTVINDALEQAATEGRYGLGQPIFAASGNSSGNSIAWPANHSETIAVGASTRLEVRASYSQYGSGLDFVSPVGAGLLTTDRVGAAGYGSGDYTNITGTSFAAPVAAGVGALMIAANPELSASSIRNLMQHSAQQIGGVFYDNGVHHEYGHGKIDAAAAVQLAIANIGNESLVSISENSTTFRRITTNSDVDKFLFEPGESGVFGFDIDNIADGDGVLDSILSVIDRDTGEQLRVSDDDVGPAPEVHHRESYAEYYIRAGQQVEIHISSFSSASHGSYSLNVSNNLAPAQNLQIDLTVNSTGDDVDGYFSNVSMTLREAIDWANLMSVDLVRTNIDFDSMNGQTILLNSQFPTVTGDLTIEGPGADLLTIDAGLGASPVVNGDGFRIFKIGDGFTPTNVAIGGLTLTGGDIGGGGAIQSRGANLTLSEVAIENNWSNFGGAINHSNGTLSIEGSTLSNNTAQVNGGAIDSGGTLTITNSTLSQNTAGGGGAIMNFGQGGSPAVLTINHSTLTGNSSSIVVNPGYSSASATINNSIVTDPMSGAASGDYNLFGTSGSTTNGPNDIATDTPLLGPLADNGGPTKTHALLPGSPAIDAGDPNAMAPAFDQRGVDRVINERLDIGSVESTPGTFLVSNIADTNDDNYSFGEFTLREAVTLANAYPGFQEIRFDDSLNGQTISLNSQLPQITGELIIGGPGADLLTIDAGLGVLPGVNDDGFRIFYVGDGSTPTNVAISGLTLTGGDISTGGAVLSRGANLTLSEVTLDNNWSRFGGAINHSNGTLTIEGSTLSNNTAQVNGGAIDSGGTLTITNSTLSQNTAGGGGAIMNFGQGGSPAVLTINHSTLTGNSSSVVVNPGDSSASATINNSIVTDPMSGAASGDYNLFGTSGSTTNGPNDIATDTPLFGPLADNGGPTKTHALLPGSPAIDAGDPNADTPPNDQRGAGFDRVVGDRIDIGAFELAVAAVDGDFDDDGDHDCDDVDALVANIAANTGDLQFDLDGSGTVTTADLNLWLIEAGGINNPSGGAYLGGDANLDGVVDVSDFNIWNGNKFTNTAAWCSGDFSADGVVDVSDFNLWNGNKFSSSDVVAGLPIDVAHDVDDREELNVEGWFVLPAQSVASSVNDSAALLPAVTDAERKSKAPSRLAKYSRDFETVNRTSEVGPSLIQLQFAAGLQVPNELPSQIPGYSLNDEKPRDSSNDLRDFVFANALEQSLMNSFGSSGRPQWQQTESSQVGRSIRLASPRQ